MNGGDIIQFNGVTYMSLSERQNIKVTDVVFEKRRVSCVFVRRPVGKKLIYRPIKK